MRDRLLYQAGLSDTRSQSLNLRLLAGESAAVVVDSSLRQPFEEGVCLGVILTLCQSPSTCSLVGDLSSRTIFNAWPPLKLPALSWAPSVCATCWNDTENGAVGVVGVCVSGDGM